jgi:hypothetical protein
LAAAADGDDACRSAALALKKRLLMLKAKAPDKRDALPGEAFAAWCDGLELLSAIPEGPGRDAYRRNLVAASGGTLEYKGSK